MATTLLEVGQIVAGSAPTPGSSTTTCERAREILRDDLRPEPRMEVSGEEYSDFMWHMCWCPDCVSYERALDPPWLG